VAAAGEWHGHQRWHGAAAMEPIGR
jgi:hypothetical protein